MFCWENLDLGIHMGVTLTLTANLNILFNQSLPFHMKTVHPYRSSVVFTATSPIKSTYAGLEQPSNLRHYNMIGSDCVWGKPSPIHKDPTHSSIRQPRAPSDVLCTSPERSQFNSIQIQKYFTNHQREII